MTPTLLFVATVVGLCAAVAFSLRDVVRAALLLVVAWAGLAVFYLWAGAEFVALAQVLVYVGALSMVVLFAVLLTRVDSPAQPEPGLRRRSGVAMGVAIALAVFGVLAWAVLQEPPSVRAESDRPALSTGEIGRLLTGPHAPALIVAGVILTVALIGAVLLAAPARKEGRR